MFVTGVPCDYAVFCPGYECCFVDAEASCSLRCCQHTAVAKPIGARANRVLMDDVFHTQCRKASVAVTRPSRSARSKSLLIEDVGDFGIDVVVEQSVYQLDDLGRRLH